MVLTRFFAGETKQQRDAGETEAVIITQLEKTWLTLTNKTL